MFGSRIKAPAWVLITPDQLHIRSLKRSSRGQLCSTGLFDVSQGDPYRGGARKREAHRDPPAIVVINHADHRRASLGVT
jgi:hypothetical protein